MNGAIQLTSYTFTQAFFLVMGKKNSESKPRSCHPFLLLIANIIFWGFILWHEGLLLKSLKSKIPTGFWVFSIYFFFFIHSSQWLSFNSIFCLKRDKYFLYVSPPWDLTLGTVIGRGVDLRMSKQQTILLEKMALKFCFNRFCAYIGRYLPL